MRDLCADEKLRHDPRDNRQAGLSPKAIEPRGYGSASISSCHLPAGRCINPATPVRVVDTSVVGEALALLHLIRPSEGMRLAGTRLAAGNYESANAQRAQHQYLRDCPGHKDLRRFRG